ncbi:MAG: hypothetical protein KHX35_09180 [Sutterella wadsworthensis]|nr:hypothetical protein [Sutterella wadsworthensis]
MNDVESVIEPLLNSSTSTTDVIFYSILIVGGIGVICHFVFRLRRVVEFIPSLITSLGILGTFIGIVQGLYHFDPSDIDGSIPTLLAGLKTAFYTSIAGIGGSIIFKLGTLIIDSIGNHSNQDENDTEDDLAPAILEAIKAQSENIDQLTKAIVGESDNSLVAQTRLLRTDMNDRAKEINEKNTSIDANLEKMMEYIGSQGDSSVITQLKYLRDDISTISKRHDNTFEAFRLDLNKRLEEFAEQLSSAASDQLVEALRQVIQDFNNKISEQLGENFKALNDAIGKLLTWQQEYKQQLVELEARYKEAVELLDQSKVAMTTIAEKSQSIPEVMKALDDLLKRQEEQITKLEAQLQTFAEMRDKAVEAVPAISQCITSMTDELKTSVNHVATELGSTAQKFNEETLKATDALTATSNQIVHNTNEVTDSLKKFSSEFVDTTGAMASEVRDHTNSVASTLKSASTSMLEETKGVMLQIQTELNTAFNQANEHFMNETQRVFNETISYTETLQHQMTKSGEASTKRIQEAGDAFSQSANRITQDTIQTTQQTMEGSRRAIETAVEQIAQKTHDEINTQIKHLDEAMTRELNNALSELGSALATIAHKLVDKYEESARRGQS